jgi:hypothetical protein
MVRRGSSVRVRLRASMGSSDGLQSTARLFMLSGIVLVVAGVVIGLVGTPIGWAVAALGLTDFVVAAVLQRSAERRG